MRRSSPRPAGPRRPRRRATCVVRRRSSSTWPNCSSTPGTIPTGSEPSASARPEPNAELSPEAVTAECARREPIDSLAWLMVACSFPSRYEATAMRAAQIKPRWYQSIRPYYFRLGRSANVWARCDRLELFPAPLPAVSVHDLAIEVRRLSYRTVTLASKHNAIAVVALATLAPIHGDGDAVLNLSRFPR
jgi:hypothetical protein